MQPRGRGDIDRQRALFFNYFQVRDARIVDVCDVRQPFDGVNHFGGADLILFRDERQVPDIFIRVALRVV